MRLPFLSLLCGLSLTGMPQIAHSDCGKPSVRFLKSERIADKSHGFTEPSGLALGQDGTHFFSVSDNRSGFYLLDPDGAFQLFQDIAPEVEDLEGISFDPAGNRILAVSEGATGVVAMDAQSGVAELILLEDMKGYSSVEGIFKTSDPNDGLEGIGVDPVGKRIFLLKEKRPRLLLELSMDLTEIRHVTGLTPALGFIDDDQSDYHLDVSGVSVDRATGCLWIVSDRGNRLFLFDPDAQGPARSFALAWLDGKKARDISNAEGVAHDPIRERLYIVTDDDKNSRLFTFEILRDGAGR